jgi:putative addiction module killer protein
MNRVPKERRILKYTMPNGKVPYDEWLDSLGDIQGKAKIQVAVERLAEGNIGSFRHLGGGLTELKIHHGPGYRVYYAEHENRVVILLCGGDKGAQGRDIEKAGKYWIDCKWRMKDEK